MSATPPKRTLTVDERFILVPDAARDALAHRLFAVDSDAARFLGWTVEEAEAAPDSHYTAVVSCRVADWADGTRFCFTIRRRTDDVAVGTLELRRDGDTAEVSYFVIPAYRAAGLATRSLVRVLEWATEELRLRVALLTCSLENPASRRVAEKSGFALVAQVGDELRFRRDLTLG
jgi:RimJ/RimL family protein N-acetyltransferase